ncbi:hypothetical protein [Conyzicola sp.]|uniref:hypothetical protein n=1 Tax=Conyzicola sp. TaxID=1969404 RepID=UPI00398A2573
MSAALERRYRAALDWYPSAWRAENGEAMLGTLLDEAEATGREKPRLGDLANLAVHGLAATAKQLPNRIPSAIRDRVAAISLGTGFALSLVLFLGAEWAPWAPNGPWNGWAFDWRVVNSEVPGFGPFASAGAVLFALWFAAFGFALVGLARTASFTLFATFPVSLLLVENAGHRMVSLRPTDGVLVVLAALALLAMAGRPTRRGQKRAGAQWLALAAGIAVILPASFAAVAIADSQNPLGWRFASRLDPWNSFHQVSSPVLFLALMAVLIVVAIARARRDWSVALGIASLPWALSLLLMLTTGGGIGTLAIYSAVGLTLLMAVAYVVLRERGYRVALVRRD